jgi:hypothetical protein
MGMKDTKKKPRADEEKRAAREAYRLWRWTSSSPISALGSFYENLCDADLMVLEFKS